MAKKHPVRIASGQKKKSAGPRIEAKFSATSGGFGFAAPIGRKGEDIFIPAQYTGGAIDGDTVSVRLLDDRERDNSRDRGDCGEVVEILSRARKFVVAEFDGKHTARPMNRHLPEQIKVNSAPKSAKRGDWVRLRLLDGGAKHTESLRAEATEDLGKAGSVIADLEAIAAEYHLESAYSDEENEAAAKIRPAKIEREDLTGAYTITIDPPSAHDFDDAISLASAGRGKAGEVVLGVHIADVAAYVRPGSTVDKDAEKRSFSAYIPGMFLPMLPKKLTAKISLREGVDSCAHSVLFNVRKTDGKIVSVRRVHSLVRIDKRLDYPTVQQFIDNPKSAPEDWDATAKRQIKLLLDIVRKMRALRKAKEEFLDMPMPEIRAVCDEETKQVTGIERKEQCEADELVEECMLAANSAVASELIERQIPGLFRIHPEPDPEKIEFFENLCLESFRFSPGDILASRKACTHFLESIPDDHRKPVILSLFLRSLPRASYDADPGLHFGLGKQRYSHFTSPIRRYPDLLVHQQLWNADTNARLKPKKSMAELALSCSEKEENNDNAYFAANDRLKIHFLKDHGALESATMYEAVISKVSNAGLVCSVDSLGIFGFIPRENLRGGDFRRAPSKKQKMTAAHGHNSYRIGDFIYVVIESIDLVRGTVVFRPAI